MWADGVSSGLMFALYVVELIVVVYGFRWCIKAARRIDTLEREVSWLKGRTAAPDAVRIADPVAGKVYELDPGSATAQRPARRP